MLLQYFIGTKTGLINNYFLGYKPVFLGRKQGGFRLDDLDLVFAHVAVHFFPAAENRISLGLGIAYKTIFKRTASVTAGTAGGARFRILTCRLLGQIDKA